ncbi:MAG: HAMP domain-containing sensor histidine kinase [Thermoflexaceae bacterium]|nr:HAMP domain-containing sensor histidine kinase [Thermoflexaceae bacterium]
MKISLKIFVFTYCIMMLVTVAGGFILIDSAYQSDIKQAMDSATENNEILYTYVATLEELPDSNYAEYSLAGLMQRMSGNGQDKVILGDYGEWKEQIVLNGYEDIAEGQIISSIIDVNRQKVIQVTSRCKDRYIINYYDITDILKRRDSNYGLYRQVIILASVVIAIILYLFSFYITRPLVKVTAMAEQIAKGDYSVRVDDGYRKMKSYEAQKLAGTLNLLGGNTEKYIQELKDSAQRKEDFLGNFTHEIKTPLTSIIGYADLLRTYDLAPDKRREYGNFIYNEGKRLEQLALNLLQIIVLGKTEFVMADMSTQELGRRLRESVRFLEEKYSVTVCVDLEPAGLKMEPSLMITAVMNLVDNACKASKSRQEIKVTGEKGEKEYVITVTDTGCGIPAEEIHKIMEPFYMVDKSRARKQGGAGLGLALVQKIVFIHKGEIEVTSKAGKGTSVMLKLSMENENKIDGGAEDGQSEE